MVRSTSSPMVLIWARFRQLRGRSERSSSSMRRSRSGEPLVADLEEAPQGLELGDTGTTTSGSPDLDLRIEELDLSERPRNCLKRAQINTIGELVERTMEDLLAITNFGQKSADEVVQRLDERGLSLRTRD